MFRYMGSLEPQQALYVGYYLMFRYMGSLEPQQALSVGYYLICFAT